MKQTFRFELLFRIILIFAVYYATARFGLSLGAVSKFATFVWPPTGIALAALLIFGLDHWPGIALAAFFVNWSLGAPAIVAAGMGAGNTIEAIAGFYILKKMGFTNSLQNLKSVFLIVIGAAFFSTLISATLGVSCLYFSGSVLSTTYLSTWVAWWLGDLMGNLLIAPFLLAWFTRRNFSKPIHQHPVEIYLISIVALFCSIFIFTDWLTPGNFLFPRPFFIFPILMVVAIRLGMRGAVTANLGVSVIVLYVTANQSGLFHGESLSNSLFEAQLFLAVLAISNMVLAAATEERVQLLFQAESALASRDEFLSIASHELKTPLTLMSLRLQLFERGLQSSMETQALNGNSLASETVNLPLSLVRAIGHCEKQTRQLAAWVDELLDLSRIRFGKLKLNKETLDLSQIAREVLEQFRAEFHQKNISTTFHSTEALVGNFDRMRMEQVISNLLSNAIKYGDGKPISVLVEKTREGLHAKLSIEDHGLGISPEFQQKIFERFARATDHETTIRGLGLGLYICRQIVETHGGSIQVTSTPGKGSAFVVLVPFES